MGTTGSRKPHSTFPINHEETLIADVDFFFFFAGRTRREPQLSGWRSRHSPQHHEAVCWPTCVRVCVYLRVSSQ